MFFQLLLTRGQKSPEFGSANPFRSSGSGLSQEASKLIEDLKKAKISYSVLERETGRVRRKKNFIILADARMDTRSSNLNVEKIRPRGKKVSQNVKFLIAGAGALAGLGVGLLCDRYMGPPFVRQPHVGPVPFPAMQNDLRYNETEYVAGAPGLPGVIIKSRTVFGKVVPNFVLCGGIGLLVAAAPLSPLGIDIAETHSLENQIKSKTSLNRIIPEMVILTEELDFSKVEQLILSSGYNHSIL